MPDAENQPGPDVLATLADEPAASDVDAMDYRTMYELVVQLTNTVMQQAVELKQEKEELEKRVAERTRALERANLDAMYMLACAAEARDAQSAEHLRRVEWLSRRLALQIGFGKELATEVGRSSVLHDVGKLHIPEAILGKAGPLTDDERSVMVRHTTVAEQIILDKPWFAVARRIARSHHEDFAGTGYPDGLRGLSIPLEARIVRVADAVDALASPRPYKLAWPIADVITYAKENAGTLFDPEVVDALVAIHAADELHPPSEPDEEWMI
ncbi:MAG: HD domain-containing protein [Tepidisphaeraceae bacterium]